jgi:hypothetical protein
VLADDPSTGEDTVAPGDVLLVATAGAQS